MLAVAVFYAALALAPCNCVAFRLDDVQDYYNRDGQIAVVKLFRDYNATLTVGVIAGALGQDKGLIQFLQENQDVVEFANHGWLHEDFSALSVQEQTRLMNQTNAKIAELFGVKPVTFIAPFNLLNNGTNEAASRNGMAIISADEKADHPAFDSARMSYHLPVNANVSDYDEEQLYWKAFENKMVLSDIKKGLEKDGYAMVMMHPRDFVDKDHHVDPVKLHQLEELLASVRSQRLKIVTVGDLAAGSANANATPANNSRTSPDLPLVIIAGGGGAMSVAASLMVIYTRSRMRRKRNGSRSSRSSGENER